MDQVRLTVFVHGHVQGVGFRWWARCRALELGVAGSATNLVDGRVCVVGQASEHQCRALLDCLRPEYSGRRPGHVDAVVEQWSEPRDGVVGFVER
ncbi:acylphosphatase [Corynebacterium sp. Marseille-Q2516]